MIGITMGELLAIAAEHEASQPDSVVTLDNDGNTISYGDNPDKPKLYRFIADEEVKTPNDVHIPGIDDPDFVWLINKHRVTGELLGPCVSFSIPTNCVRAHRLADGSWVEIEEEGRKDTPSNPPERRD